MKNFFGLVKDLVGGFLGVAVGGSVVVTILLLLCLYPLVGMLLWNWLMPMLFKLPEVGFWQMVGLLLLARLLFPISNAKCECKK